MPTTLQRKRPIGPSARRALVGLGIVVLVVVGGATAASAHATLVATTPADGQSVATPPETVSATFTEDVTAEVGGLTVRDSDGDRVDDGDSSVDGATLSVTVPGDLPEGTYVATYRVLSADGHPVSGSWLFAVGTGPVDPSAASVGATGDEGWELAGGVARFLTSSSALLAAGVAFFVAFLHDQRADRWKLVPVVRIAAIVGLFGAAATIAAQAALLTGRGLDAVTDGEVLRSVLTDRLGWASAVLLLGLAAAHLSTDTDRLRPARILTVAGGVAVAASFALWGHDTEAPHRWLAVGSDLVHVAAAAVWLGGLVGLTLVLRRRAPHPVRSTADVLGRFSTAAAISAAALVAAGVAMAWIEIGSLDNLWSTTYGRLVAVKVAITAGVLAMAAVNRFRLIPAIVAGADADPVEPDPQVVTVPDVADDEADDDDEPTERERQSWRWIELRRMVGYEALALVAVLGFTAALVATTPARTAALYQANVINLTDDTESGEVNLVVTPARAGTNTIHVQFYDEAGHPVDIADTLTIELSLPEKDLGPISRQVVKVSPGHFILEGDELSLAGDWTVTVIARTSDFTEERTSFGVTVS